MYKKVPSGLGVVTDSDEGILLNFQTKSKTSGFEVNFSSAVFPKRAQDNRFGKVHVCNISEQVDYALKRGKVSLRN